MPLGGFSGRGGNKNCIACCGWQFATLALLYWTVDELTAVSYLAERLIL
jgi:hypothetical protein